MRNLIEQIKIQLRALKTESVRHKREKREYIRLRRESTGKHTVKPKTRREN